ncbi:MAG: Holliday junction resolvase [Candidatus Methanomethylophilaceae archaeon]|jgi:Holliday junction resolvase
MAVAGDIYERELKSLLTGDPKTVAKMVKTCGESEKKAYESMLEEPFLVVRAAGSLGVDLVALRWDFSFPIEVKSTADGVLHFSRNPRLTEQAQHMSQECRKSHLVPIYAFRLKGVRGDPWRVFTLPGCEELRGRSRLLGRRIPDMEVSGNGNYIMKWDNGMKLSDLLMYIGMSDFEND